MLQIVGISGKLQSGKDTTAAFIQEEALKVGFKCETLHFATALKKEVAEFVCGRTWKSAREFFMANESDLTKVDRLSQCFEKPPTSMLDSLLAHFFGKVNKVSYEGCDPQDLYDFLCIQGPVKDNFRYLLQWWGTEYRRNQDQNYWLDRYKEQIKILEEQYAKDRLLVFTPDMRFGNEFKKIIALRGYTIRVDRPTMIRLGVEHASETALDDCKTFHARVINEGDLDELQFNAIRVFYNMRGWMNDGESS